TNLEAIHARHHDVEQHHVDGARAQQGKGALAAARGHDLEVLGGEPSLEQLEVGEDVVNDQNAGSHWGTNATTPKCSCFTEVATHGRQKRPDRNRFGDIGFAAALSDPRLVTLHGEGGDGDHRDFAQLIVVLQPLCYFQTGDLRQLDI